MVGVGCILFFRVHPFFLEKFSPILDRVCLYFFLLLLKVRVCRLILIIE
jgi:hypothetical protein